VRNAKNILKHELIGLEVQVVEANNQSLVGINGYIVDETKFTFTILTKNGERKVLKKGMKITMTVDDGNIVVTGDNLVGRPEDRIKK
jgi:ribonuclease P protein subunit POP4